MERFKGRVNENQGLFIFDSDFIKPAIFYTRSDCIFFCHKKTPSSYWRGGRAGDSCRQWLTDVLSIASLSCCDRLCKRLEGSGAPRRRSMACPERTAPCFYWLSPVILTLLWHRLEVCRSRRCRVRVSGAWGECRLKTVSGEAVEAWAVWAEVGDKVSMNFLENRKHLLLSVANGLTVLI